MQCNDIRDMLSAYIDEVLDDKEKAEVENHLRICRVCNQDLADLQETVLLLRSLGEVSPPVDFRKRLRERLEREAMAVISREGRRQSWFKNIKSGAWKQLAAAIVIIGLGVGAGVYALSAGSFARPHDDWSAEKQKVQPDSRADNLAGINSQEYSIADKESAKKEFKEQDAQSTRSKVARQAQSEDRTKTASISAQESQGVSDNSIGIASKDLTDPMTADTNSAPAEERALIASNEPDARNLTEPASVNKNDAMEDDGKKPDKSKEPSAAYPWVKWIIPLTLLLIIPALTRYFFNNRKGNKQ